MKKFTVILASLACTLCATGQSSYLIEAEAFQFKGKWVVEKSSECLGTAMLRVYQDSDSDPASDALTVVNINETGTYDVWTRSRDYATGTRPRSYTLSVGGVTMQPSGTHGTEGFEWEKVGSVDLGRKQTLLRIHDSGLYFGRCDAILLTKDSSIDPNKLSNAQVAQWRKSPVTMPTSTATAPALGADAEIGAGYSVLATATGSDIRVSFVRLSDGRIVCKTDYRNGGSWRRFHSTAEDNRIALISNNSKVTYNHNGYYPAWDYCSARHTFSFEGESYSVTLDGDRSNPYYTGTLSEARATAVTKTAGNIIKVSYDCGGAGTLTGYWTVPEEGRHVELRLLFKPVADGSYSLALHGAKGLSDSDVSSVLLPPMFRQGLMPDTPLMLFSSMTTQCLAAVETADAAGAATAFVSVHPDALGGEWGSYDYSAAGLALRNSAGELEPVVFAPCPGMKDSWVKAGRSLEARFICGISAGDMAEALEYASGAVFGVEDYRRQTSQSLTSTLYNTIKLIKDDNYSGWNSAMKGFWDIEADGRTAPTVVQSSPLALVGAALACDDEELYASRALPAIEYVLSGRNFRTAGNTPAALSPLSSQFPTTAYEGLNTLTGGLNPWLEALALPEGRLRTANGYFTTVPAFRQALSAYTLTGDERWLDRAEAEAGTFMASLSDAKGTVPAAGTFYNSQNNAPWQSLFDLYRATGDTRYAEGAIAGATHTLAGIKTWPKVAEGTQTVHPGGVYDGITSIWWKGSEQFRLGFPRVEGDAPEHEVEAWQVSGVGLGIEQPATYFVRTAGKTVHPVFMSSWAPGLVSLSAATGKDIYETYARNAVIGRADTYPGYYATGYTDLPCGADYPWKGPDVSSIYYHHLPAWLALVQDYLVSTIEARSEGAISFPAARQEGFVWFNNKIHGRGEGMVHGRKARLWMPAGAVESSNAEVNYISAIGENQLYIMLTGEGAEVSATRLSFGQDIISRLSSAVATIIDSEGRESTADMGGSGLDVEVPARGCLTVALDLIDEGSEAPEALAQGYERVSNGTAAGDIYLYRIRSPFGWDSVYGVAGCASVSGMSIDVECNGSHVTADKWPYEWSFGRYGYDEAVEIDITVNMGGKPAKTLHTDFTPGSTGVENVSVTPAEAPDGIYRPDGTRVSQPQTTGIYIVNGTKRFIKL